MKIAITGAGGQLGSELCRILGSRALPLDHARLDITDRDAVRRALLAERPTAVINAAAYTAVDKAEQEREAALRANADAVGYLAEACAELDCPLVQVSTDYVFCGNAERGVPFAEHTRPHPLGAYAQTKFEGEQRAAAWAKHFIVRTCGLYGRAAPGKRPNNFVETMLRLGRERDRLRIVDDQRCTPTDVPHFARALEFLAGSEAYGLYHVTNSGSASWHEFAAEIFRQAGIEIVLERITTADYAAPAPRPPYSVLDTRKYHALGGPPMPTWQEGLAAYLRAREERY